MSNKNDDDDNKEQAARLPVETVHRQLAFSFIRAIRSLDLPKVHSESAVANLAKAFDVDPAGVDGQHDAKVDLIALFEEAAAKRENVDDNDEKFLAFKELLNKKGYFTGAPEGTEEYSSRLQRAKAKFRAKSNPYDGLTAVQLKEKGNELMALSKYREAVGYYTKAIELESNNHIYFANRAAAFSHLKDHVSAINDCEKAIAINPKYPKAFHRLGTAHYFEGNYQRAADSFARALELDPDSEKYKTDLDRAKEKVAEVGPAAASRGGAGGVSAFPGFGGMDMSKMMEMMQQPGFQSMATNMMKDPNFMGMVSGMAQNMGMKAPSQAELESFVQNGPPKMDPDGNFDTPFGRMNRDRLDQMRQEQFKNPKMRAIIEDVQANGPMAMTKYMGDPEVMQQVQELMGQLQQQPAGAGAAASRPQLDE